MQRGKWSEPITFETMKLGQYRTINSASEAAHVLMGAWLIADGRALRKACDACLAALEGKETPEAACKAFIRAAEETDVFVRPQR